MQQLELQARENQRRSKTKHSPLPVSLRSAEAVGLLFTMPREMILSSVCWVKTWSIFRWAWSSISTWINATKQSAKEKTIDENTRGLLIGRFFVSISTKQSKNKCSDQSAKQVKALATKRLKQTLVSSYDCLSSKGCFSGRRLTMALAFNLTLFPLFNTGCFPGHWEGFLCKHALL